MKKRLGLGLLALGIGLPYWLSARPSYGLPGYSVNEVKTWMQGHPTLRADSREGLRVHRSDVPSRRFTFQASVFPVVACKVRERPRHGLSPVVDLTLVRFVAKS